MLAVTAVGAFMTPFDSSVVAVALPHIGRSLHLSFVAGLWVQTAYVVVVAAVLVPWGRLADRVGRLRLYRLGVAGFGLTSLAAGLAWSGPALLVARCLQAASGGVISATAAAIVTEAFPPERRGRALGINSTSTYLGVALGPVLGGLLTQDLGWRSIFFVNLPVAAATLLLARRVDPGRPSERGRGAIGPDILPFSSGVVALLVGLTFGPVWGWGAAATGALLAGGCALLAVFLALESRLARPLIDVALFRTNRVFAAANLAALANFIAFTAVSVLTAVFLEVVDGRSAGAAGLLLAIQPVLVVLLTSSAGRLSDRIGSRWLATGGMLLISAGLALLATVPAHAGPARLEVALAIAGIGTAAFASPNTSSVMGAVGRRRLGLAAGTLGTMRFFGASLSLAVLGAIATASLGPTGQLLILTGRAPAGAAARYVVGYHLAMAVAAGIALVGAACSLARGPSTAIRQRPAVPAPEL